MRANNNRSSIQILVKTPTGNITTLEVRLSDTIDDIITRVFPEEFISKKARLIFAGKQLELGRTLSDYHIKKDALLHAVFRLPGGMNTTTANNLKRSFAEKKPRTSSVRGRFFG